MESAATTFMRELEVAYREASGLPNRSAFKIFYCQVRPARILALGINPGGSPIGTSADGTLQSNGERASASAGYFENGENDLLDCNYRENPGLKALLLPLVSASEARLREEVVRTNMAFRRTAKARDLDRPTAYAEAVPFLHSIIERVAPKLVVLTGVGWREFTSSYATQVTPVESELRDPRIGHVVFAAARASLPGVPHETLVVQVAHASQFSWTYAQYNVAQRAIELLGS